jgi:hypothetical protein
VDDIPIPALIAVVWIFSSSAYCWVNWERIYPPLNTGRGYYNPSVRARNKGLLSFSARYVVVATTADAVTIRYGLPQSVLFFFGFFSRDLVIPRSAIKSTRYTRTTNLTVSAVQIAYNGQHGMETIDLYTRDPDTLYAAAAAITYEVPPRKSKSPDR